ncbi:hypothetical protein RCKEMMY_49 [Rhodobacter phage RcKemmy]|nr:hypothetical protein RCKEMMY_49 [Rhodobacter phage RcKemmy]
MNRSEVLTLGVVVSVAAFAADLVRFLGWHWLAWWPVFGFSFVGLIFVAVFMARAGSAFLAGFRRGFKRGRGK